MKVRFVYVVIAGERTKGSCYLGRGKSIRRGRSAALRRRNVARVWKNSQTCSQPFGRGNAGGLVFLNLDVIISRFCVQVVPISIKLIEAISSVRIYLSKDLKPKDSRQTVLRTIQVPQKESSLIALRDFSLLGSAAKIQGQTTLFGSGRRHEYNGGRLQENGQGNGSFADVSWSRGLVSCRKSKH